MKDKIIFTGKSKETGRIIKGYYVYNEFTDEHTITYFEYIDHDGVDYCDCTEEVYGDTVSYEIIKEDV